MKLNFVILFFVLPLAACATSYDGLPHNYTGTGGLQGLLEARNQCLAEMNGRSGNVNVTVNVSRYGGGNLTNCGALNSCVASKGYLREAKGNITLPRSFAVNCQ